MLEHQSEDNSEVEYTLPPNQKPESVLSASSEEEIEDYLDRGTAPLIHVLPRSKRTAIRAHLRAQLEASIVACRELGDGEAEAVQNAIRQSGDPELIAQRWVVGTPVTTSSQSSRQSVLHSAVGLKPPSARKATLAALVAFGVPYLADLMQWTGNYWAARSDNTVTYYRFFLFGVPLLAGLVTGLLARHRPVRGVLNALGLLCIPALLLPGLLIGLSYAHLFFTKDQVPWINPLPGMSGLIPWVVMGCLGAVAGQKLRTPPTKLRSRLARQVRSLRKREAERDRHSPRPGRQSTLV